MNVFSLFYVQKIEIKYLNRIKYYVIGIVKVSYLKYLQLYF